MTDLCGECVESFTEIANKHAYNGIGYPPSRTLESCKTTCRKNKKCFDFNTIEIQCCFHTENRTLHDEEGMNHYTLDRRCPCN